MSFNVKYIPATGEILSAGYCDFTPELGDGEKQASINLDFVPENIDSHWIFTGGQFKQREEPLPTLRDRLLAKEADKMKENYAKCQTPEEKMAYMEKLLKLT